MAIVHLCLGSETDAENANHVLRVWHDLHLDYVGSYLSAHRQAGAEFTGKILAMKEPIIAFMGGLSLAAPGEISGILVNNIRPEQIVFGIPTDRAARSAIENLPAGTVVLTSGLNEISPRHGFINSALAIARIANLIEPNRPNIINWHIRFNQSKPSKKIQFDPNGLIPELKK